jgi:hypothetical protein
MTAATTPACEICFQIFSLLRCYRGEAEPFTTCRESPEDGALIMSCSVRSRSLQDSKIGLRDGGRVSDRCSDFNYF